MVEPLKVTDASKDPLYKSWHKVLRAGKCQDVVTMYVSQPLWKNIDDDIRVARVRREFFEELQLPSRLCAPFIDRKPRAQRSVFNVKDSCCAVFAGRFGGHDLDFFSLKRVFKPKRMKHVTVVIVSQEVIICPGGLGKFLGEIQLNERKSSLI